MVINLIVADLHPVYLLSIERLPSGMVRTCGRFSSDPGTESSAQREIELKTGKSKRLPGKRGLFALKIVLSHLGDGGIDRRRFKVS
jgi:hypothetical protein